MKIIVIDDEASICTLTSKILERAGHSVITAHTGEEGVELIRRNPDMIDAVILDLTMPGLSGIDTLREIRKLADSIPCVLSSGNPMVPDDLPVDLKTSTYFLQKPYRSQSLTDIINVLPVIKLPDKMNP
jgi:DNA-binding response OmpR family regulator